MPVGELGHGVVLLVVRASECPNLGGDVDRLPQGFDACVVFLLLLDGLVDAAAQSGPAGKQDDHAVETVLSVVADSFPDSHQVVEVSDRAVALDGVSQAQ